MHSGRLVNEDGIIYPPAFYTYLTAWNSNDMLASSAAMPNFHPIPREWYSDRQDRQEENLKSKRLVKTEGFSMTSLHYVLI